MSTFLNVLCTVFTLITLMIISSTYGLDNIHERCTITEGAGVAVDSCDGSKFMSCQNGRCTCNDAANQIYTYRMEKEKRQRRGLGKKIAIGAGGAFVGYQVAKATSGGGGQSSNDRESSKHKVFSCYGRVGAACALNYNNVNIVKLANSSSEHSQNETEHESNSTTSTTAAPVIFDLTKLPKCVDHAVCKPRDNSTSLTTDDPRVGVCSCDNGFKRTATDICESKAFTVVPSSFIIMALIFLSHNMFF